MQDFVYLVIAGVALLIFLLAGWLTYEAALLPEHHPEIGWMLGTGTVVMVVTGFAAVSAMSELMR